MGTKANILLNLTFIIFLFLSFFTSSYGQKNLEVLEKTASEYILSTYLNTNNISTIFYNDGRCDFLRGNSGFEFPKGSGKHAIYSSGLLWGALTAGNKLKIGGSAYDSNLLPGKILPDGTPDVPLIPRNRIYRVRPDIYPGGPYVNLSAEIRDEGDTYENIRSRYEDDWIEWRAEDGAPFVDKDLNGVYDPTIDVPGVKNAAQTMWYVANDFNELDSLFFTPKAHKLGLEVQVTIWAYQSEPIFSNSLFRKYKMINKSQNEFKDMYISQWNDPDLGSAGDDYVGTDTLRNMIYVYNSDDFDTDYGSKIPAAGFQLLQGPIVAGNAGEDRNKNGIDDASDFAIYENNLKGPGFINLPMTASYQPQKFNGPNIGDTSDFDAWYQFFQGKDGNLNGIDFIDPNTGEATIYPLSGDPVTQTGWLDGQVFPAGDKRMGFASGPFNLAAGDTQEVVIAALAEMGQDRLESITLLRYYADEIQSMYKSLNFPEKLPAPQSPDVTTKITVDGILLDWGSNSSLVSEIENYNSEGYKFQGYNVYQAMVSESGVSFNSKAAIFDIVDGVTTIYGDFRDSVTGLPTQGVKQQGTDSGIERTIFFDKDNEFDSPLIKGKEYVFGVSAYTYNENPTNGISTTETPIHYFNVAYLDTLPGANHGDPITFIQSAGGGESENIEISVAEPSKLTGDDYEIFFTTVNYYRDVDGEWYPFAKVGDLTGSRLEVRPFYGIEPNTIEMEFELFNESPNGAWIDGIVISFPAGTNIISAPEFYAGGGTVTPEINDRHIMMGLVNNQYSQIGIFHGDEKWNVIIQSTAPPINLEYILKDDGWESNPIDVTDSLFIDEIGFASKTEKYWNLRNITKNDTVLFNQTVMDGIDIYTNEIVPNPIADGVQIKLQVNYEMPNTFDELYLNSNILQRHISFQGFDVTDYTLFGVFPATAVNSSLGAGTSDSSLLIKDYEIRFNGTATTEIIDGKPVEQIVSGGQLATLYGARMYDIADHPMNPNPGVSEPFTIRIPFEVWSIDDNKQINFMVYDRQGDPASSDTFKVWNTDARMYTAFVMSDYHENVINPSGEEAQNYATWNLVWYDSEWQQGDVIKVIYKNPITPNDKFTFTAPQRFNKEDFRVPESFELYHNFPNPFNPTTTIRFDLPEDNNVKLEVFNILGQKVRTLVNDFYKGGIHEVQFNSRGLASGVYIYRLEAGTHINVKKMVLLK